MSARSKRRLSPCIAKARFMRALFLTALGAMAALTSSCAMPFRGPAYQEVGLASWYGEDFHGRPTASGEIYNMNRVSAAHRTLPLGTKVKVTNLENGKTIKTVINDRGPFVDGRIIDLSKGAAKKLDMQRQGIAKVKIEASELHGSSASPDKSAGQLYTVQVGSFSDRKLANKLLEQLRQWRKDAYIVQYETKRGIFHRVRVGSFESMDEAETLSKELKQRGHRPFVAAR